MFRRYIQTKNFLFLNCYYSYSIHILNVLRCSLDPGSFYLKLEKELEVIKIYAVDFEYDGIRLRDLGYTICSFDGGGFQTSSNGAQITFNNVSTKYGERWLLANAEYTECLEATFSICKIPCMNNGENNISLIELRYLMRWLNRKKYHKLKFIGDGCEDFYFWASFNVNKIEFGTGVVGLELAMLTNSSYAFRESKTHLLESEKSNWKVDIISTSDDEGYIYPRMEIEIKEDGDLTIQNDMDQNTMEIKNCVANEIITLDYPFISSSLPSHEIQNDFNWHFLRMVKTFQTGKNHLLISIPCKIKITYSPIVKIGI